MTTYVASLSTQQNILVHKIVESLTSQQKAGWSEKALRQAISLTLKNGKKLEDSEAFQERPVKIRATSLASADVASSATVENEDSKIIHFQRHGQGYHNLLGDLMRELGHTPSVDSLDPMENPWIRPEIVDSPLTEKGRQECADRRQEASLLHPQLVIMSPLQRAIQTAQISFSSPHHHQVEGQTIPWLVHEGCREELGVLVCNKRRPVSESKAEFPQVDFSFIQTDQDNLWNAERRETHREQADRAYDFLVNFVRNRPEKEIAVVCHSSWLFGLCNAVLDCGEDESLKMWFLTSEIRSMRVTFSDN